MKWTLTDSEGTAFDIANGEDRLHQVAAEDRGTMQQQTPVDVFLEDAAPTAFLDQAIRSEGLQLMVTFPPCETYVAAFLLARTVKAACPKGGILRGHMDGAGVEYGQAWVNAITHERTGVATTFVFDLTLTREAVKSWYADEDGDLYTDELGVPYEV